MRVLVTGGAGYIGSHAALMLLQCGHEVTIVDNLLRGHREVIDILNPLGKLHFVQADLRDQAALAKALRAQNIDAVMHFAALASVPESVAKPELYRDVNVDGTRCLLAAMADASVTRMIFSSSAAVYGQPSPDQIPIRETCELAPINPYGNTKLVGEQLVQAWVARDPARRTAAMLRYFNVAGADPEGRLGEDHDPETHLIPLCLDAALGRVPQLQIFGTDYDTPDGTCLRDYIHVTDLADAHFKALFALQPGEAKALNVGLGRAFSVRQVVDACRKVTGVDLPVREGPRREGDPAALLAEANLVRRTLDWRPAHDAIEEMVATAWHWRKENPAGFGSPLHART